MKCFAVQVPGGAAVLCRSVVALLCCGVHGTCGQSVMYGAHVILLWCMGHKLSFCGVRGAHVIAVVYGAQTTILLSKRHRLPS